MKSITKLGLVAVAAAAIAMLTAASASAYETVLCKEATNLPYCKSSERYPANTTISASLGFVGAPPTFETSTTNVVCNESTMTGKTTAESGTPLPISISAWTLGNCKAVSKGTECTVTPVASAPYSGTLNRTSGSNGTMAIGSGGSGNPGWTVKCGVLMNCTWTLEPNLTYKGLGSSAEAIASKVPLTRQSGFCPTSATFSGTYVVKSPQPARLAIPKEAPTEPVTALCKTLDNYYCETADLYSKGSILEGQMSNPVFNTGSYPYGNFICEKGNLHAETTADYGAPLPVSLELSSFYNCYRENTTMACEVKTTAPGSGGISQQNGDGSWSGFGATVKVQCGLLINCTLSPVNNKATLVRGEPAKIEGILEWTASGSACPSSVKLELGSGLSLSTPSGPLVVTDALR